MHQPPRNPVLLSQANRGDSNMIGHGAAHRTCLVGYILYATSVLCNYISDLQGFGNETGPTSGLK